MSLPTPKWKEKAVQLNDAADAKVDSFLDKIKASSRTPVILVCAVAVVILAWIVG